MRRAVDASDQPGQFLLTGSVVPAEDASRHTGAGRFGFLRMRPMSLFESGVSNGAVSLRQLFAGEVQAVADPGLSVQDLGALIARGGWPAQQGSPLKAATRAARDYLEQVRQVDISRVDRRRDPARVGALLRSLGRRCRPGRAHRDLRQAIWLSPARWGCGGAGWCPWSVASLLQWARQPLEVEF